MAVEHAVDHIEKTATITTTISGTPDAVNTLQNLGENVIYLMGFSFILGSLFTILVLIMLDVMRHNAMRRVRTDAD